MDRARNYVRLFTADLFFGNSLLVTATTWQAIPSRHILYALVLALLLNQKIRGRGASIAPIFYLPTIVPIVASSALWLWLYNPNFGLFNEILQGLGLRQSLWLSSRPPSFLPWC